MCQAAGEEASNGTSAVELGRVECESGAGGGGRFHCGGSVHGKLLGQQLRERLKDRQTAFPIVVPIPVLF